MVFGVMVIVFGFLFFLIFVEWLWLLLVVFFVWLVEIINIIFENVVDMFMDFYFYLIGKKVKDMVVGVVLLIVGFVVLVGLILFVLKIL